ncbi:hypothetical protein THIX_60410 [Thiomonas sp. X19]|uniref:3-dehydroquinate synthase family protein n=1 Tax=Thiomonas sp. X19 TaxID=1050370 RepID=UPI000B645BCE|nr:hypothetical protein [Thiomonas sp. X19]SCC94352.1 hypothetical protein THIX_60410 [Thiomonas sp. X19]
MPAIYEKTPAGRQTLSTRQPALSRASRTLLLLIDGRKSDEELLALLASAELSLESLSSLEALGLIAVRPQPAADMPIAEEAQSAPSSQPVVKAPPANTSTWARLTQGLRSALQAREESPRERAAGLAEVIKCAAVGDAVFFAWLEVNVDAILSHDAKAVGQMMQQAQALRETIDIADRVQRRVPPHLDFGWALGKVVESILGYGRYLHGEALALGMVLATDIGAIQGVQSEVSAKRLLDLLGRCGLPMRVPRVAAARWLESLPVDQAGAAGQVHCVLIEDIGKPVSAAVSRSVVVEALERAGALAG